MPAAPPPFLKGDRVIVYMAYKTKEFPVEICGRRRRFVYRCPRLKHCQECAPFMVTQLPIGEVIEVIQHGGWNADDGPPDFRVAVRVNGEKWWTRYTNVVAYSVIEEIGALSSSI